MALYNLIKGESLFDGKVKEIIDTKVVSGDFIDTLLPWRLQQSIDTSASGGLNYKGIET